MESGLQRASSQIARLVRQSQKNPFQFQEMANGFAKQEIQENFVMFSAIMVKVQEPKLRVTSLPTKMRDGIF
jgi:hypothetical protein